MEEALERPIRGYQGQPSRVEVSLCLTLSCVVDQEAVTLAKFLLGWRGYVSNAPPSRLCLSDVVFTYQDEYRIEHGFSRLKGHPLSLCPMYLPLEDHVKGLIRLFVLGLGLLTLLEFVVRRALEAEPVALVGLYVANPKRATLHPTAERLLEAFKHITLLFLPSSGPPCLYLSALTSLQQRILGLLGASEEVYTRLREDSTFSPQKMSEP